MHALKQCKYQYLVCWELFPIKGDRMLRVNSYCLPSPTLYVLCMSCVCPVYGRTGMAAAQRDGTAAAVAHLGGLRSGVGARRAVAGTLRKAHGAEAAEAWTEVRSVAEARAGEAGAAASAAELEVGKPLATLREELKGQDARAQAWAEQMRAELER